MLGKSKNSRFGRPEFKEKLARARQYQRSPSTLASRFSKFMALGVLAVVFYFLGISRTFVVSEATVNSEGPSSEQVSDVLKKMSQESLGYVVPMNHMAVLNRSRMLAALQQELPQVRQIKSFKRIFPNKLELVLEERQPLYVWQSGAGFFLLDQDGVIFRELASYSPQTFSQILITDTSETEVQTGQELEVRKTLSFVEEIKNNWALYIPHTNFVSFSIPGIKSQDILARTATGYRVYFDMDRKAVKQLSNLKLILDREIKPETYSGLSYIDLRLSTIAYYCYKDAECALDPSTGAQGKE